MPSDTEQNSDSESKAETEKTDKSPSSNKEAPTKRRTKTGCLTCRKRRIKCGEERPICKNCIKSRRECAGYNHPLIYKQHGQSGSIPLDPSGWSHSRISHPTTLPALVKPILRNPQPPPPIQTGLWPGKLVGTEIQLDGAPTWSAGGVRSAVHIVNPSHWPQQYNNNSPGNSADNGSITDISALTPASLSSSNKGQPDLTNRYTSLGFVQRSVTTATISSHTDTHQSDYEYPSFGEQYDDPEDPWDVDMDHDDKVAYLSQHEARSQYTSTAIVSRSFQSPTSPLLEGKSQRIFRHFLAVTGPCMGTFERHDATGDLGPPKMVWTHSLPAMAFSAPALAHAILAVSAMHMSKLDLCSESTAVKHFTYALRRVGRALGQPQLRHKVSTLATVLLLGYYEVMSGDHSRWSLHLSGAGKLVMEHNYAGMMQTIRRLRGRGKNSISQSWLAEQAVSNEHYVRVTDIPPNLLDDNDWKVDQELVSRLMGCEVNYDTQVQPNFQSDPTFLDFTQQTLNDWKVLTEIYWWYCRQDIFMSMLSGDPLLLPYSQWKYCPPRGPLDNPQRPYTTIDHLWLVIARLTDFGGKDRKRKQRVVRSQGGHWIPAPGFLDPVGPPHPAPRPSANEGRARIARQSPGQPPPPPQPAFYGMMPPATGPIHMSNSFEFMRAELRGDGNVSPASADSPLDQDLDLQTQHALNEHALITEAFDLFESSLGSGFEPLTPGEIQITTPFGPALSYRTPIIATMWTFLLAGRILLRRLHPYSPPAAVVSAGVNARYTHEYSQLIGRICGGLYAQQNYLLQAGYVDHVLSGTVMETTLSLLFAAVQYQDPVQRGWTIGKLSEIAQTTGWKTAAAVAAACESTWEGAGRSGKGPTYQRTMDRDNEDARLNGRWKVFQHKQPARIPNLSVTEEHESRFVSHDRELIDKHVSTRAHWAFGLLSADEDLQKLSLDDDD